MPQGILGRKVGMTAVFMEDGRQIPVTVIDTRGNRVVGKRTEERDGYTAVTLGFGDKPLRRMNNPTATFFRKADLVEDQDGVEVAKRYVREFRVSADALGEYEIGAIFNGARLFGAGQRVDVTATSKGRGFTGVMKRHNFRGFKASHGVHEYFRHGGSISMNTTPARVFKNKKMPGQHGNKQVTIQSVLVVEVMEEEGLMLIKGNVPGPNGGLVKIQDPAKGKRFR